MENCPGSCLITGGVKGCKKRDKILDDPWPVDISLVWYRHCNGTVSIFLGHWPRPPPGDPRRHRRALQCGDAPKTNKSLPRSSTSPAFPEWFRSHQQRSWLGACLLDNGWNARFLLNCYILVYIYISVCVCTIWIDVKLLILQGATGVPGGSVANEDTPPGPV